MSFVIFRPLLLLRMGSYSFYLCFCHFIKLVHCYLFSNLSFLSFNSSWYSWIIRSLVNGKLVGIHFQTIFERKPSKHVWRQGLSPFGKKLKKKETGREENKIPRSQMQVSFWLRGFPENRTSIWLVWSSVFTLWTLSSISLSRHHGRNYPGNLTLYPLSQ